MKLIDMGQAQIDREFKELAIGSHGVGKSATHGEWYAPPIKNTRFERLSRYLLMLGYRGVFRGGGIGTYPPSLVPNGSSPNMASYWLYLDPVRGLRQRYTIGHFLESLDIAERDEELKFPF